MSESRCCEGTLEHMAYMLQNSGSNMRARRSMWSIQVSMWVHAYNLPTRPSQWLLLLILSLKLMRTNVANLLMVRIQNHVLESFGVMSTCSTEDIPTETHSERKRCELKYLRFEDVKQNSSLTLLVSRKMKKRHGHQLIQTQHYDNSPSITRIPLPRLLGWR
jgi:DNA phosphorothioation-dependent restriction protein DptG